MKYSDFFENLKSWWNETKTNVQNFFNNNSVKTGENTSGTNYTQALSLNTSGAQPAATTYSDNVAPDNTETVPTSTPKVEEKSTSTTGNTSTETSTETTDKTEEPMTYEEYIEQAKANEETKRQQALKDAETYKERAAADAQNAYETNKATYGANAETMAQMGLTGGGYSDYLDAQAYAGKRSDMQKASANELALKQQAETTYQDNILTLDGQLATHKAEKDAADKQYKTSIYNSLWEEVQKEDTNYTVESVTALARKAGLTDEEIATLTGMLNTTLTNKANKEQAEKDAAEQAEQEKAAKYSDELKVGAISDIETKGGLSADFINSLSSAGMDADDVAEVVAYNQKWWAKNYRDTLQTGELMDIKKLQNAKADGLLTEADYNALVPQLQENYYNAYNTAVSSDFASIDTADIDKLFKGGNISQSQYNSLKETYNKGIASAISTSSLFYSSGAQIDSAAAKAVMDELIATGWVSEDNKTKMQSLWDKAYNTSSDDGGGGCYAKGTLITIADGTKIEVEKLKIGDKVLVFNHELGNVDTSPVSYIFYDGQKEYDTLKLIFDISEIEVLYGHGFFDLDLNKYVLINAENVKDYIGHKFYYIQDIGGQPVYTIASLNGYEQYTKQTESYSVLTAKHINCIANGILTVTDDGNQPAQLLKGFYNIFDLDMHHRFDTEKMAADIQKYGISTYDEWKEYATEEQFDAFNGKYLKIAIGKGLVTKNEVVGYINKFLQK